MDSAAWYRTLEKPSWAPPPWVFGPVWAFLYLVIAVSFGYAAYLFLKKRIGFRTVLPFLLNLFFNFSFSPVQFGLKNNLLAAAVIALVLGTLIWAVLAIYPRVKWPALANIPYLLWVCFAAVLQFTITFMNF